VAGVISRMRRQRAVYWPATSIDSQNRVVLGTPVQIDCRWEEKSTEFIDIDGQPTVSSVVVYVDRDVTLRGYLWLGLLASAPTDPRVVSSGREIRSFEKIPNFRNTDTLRTVRS
jgi:hypothetical protein